MPRPSNPDLIRNWKIALPATLAGTVEFLLMDPITRKPRYSARSKLIQVALERWVAEYEGRTPPPMPSLDEIRN